MLSCNPQSKGTTASNSFSFRKNPAASTCSPIDEHHEILDIQTPLPVSAAQPVKSELSVNQDNDNLVTLVHTVSFYRRQQSANVSLNQRKDLKHSFKLIYAHRAPTPRLYERSVGSSR